MIRIIAFNPGYFNPFSSFKHHSASAALTPLNASVSVLSPHFLCITIRRPSYFHWRPGQSAYLTVPAVSALEAHPFTICTVDVREGSSAVIGGSGAHSDIEVEDKGKSQKVFERKLMFLVRVRGGFTKKLMSKVESGSRPQDDGNGMKVLLDGPYSSPPSLLGYETVFLIAGESWNSRTTTAY